MDSSGGLVSMPYYEIDLLIWEGCHCTNLTCAAGMVRALERLDGL